MSSNLNRQVRLHARPTGLPSDEVWAFTSEVLREPADGEFLAKILYISLDPAMRVWMNAGDTYVPGVRIGDVMRAGVLARVVKSRHPGYAVGSHVMGRLGVQEFAYSDGTDMIGQPVVPIDQPQGPLSTYLGVLGVPGLTAYFGLLEVARPSAGETVVVSGATGAVGSVVGQIARIKGCRVIGITGGPEKCRYLTETLGFDGAVDYLSGDIATDLARLCPNGIDVYFDNAGGEILDAALATLAMRARVVLCGSMSQYNTVGPVRGPENYRALVVKRARMEGIIVYDYMATYEKARAEMAGWLAEGRLLAREEVVTGLESFPEALRRMLTGAKFGKLLISLQDR
ncbi:MAG: NADP-dependent oxidoreductase [Burkholderiaceae bacterium]|nr:NADP-dependent oxidoreductase [Burkholderiaceae bacterium]